MVQNHSGHLFGVPQGTVLGPLLFSLYINDIMIGIESEIRLFADDCVSYRQIDSIKDTPKLQKDIDQLGKWARKWGMRWNTHVSNVRTKANRTLGFLRGNISSCLQDVKEMAYKDLVRPGLEYANPVLDPHGIVVQEELEKVQNCVARFVTAWKLQL